MTTASNSAILDPVTNPVLTVAPQNKEDTTMSGATNKITALYCRLSQEDARLGESLSIENQKVILLEYAKKNHFPNPVFFVDDGYSGTNYDRPGFQSMLVEIEAGRVGIVITKDLSRLGRNSALTGLYTNFTFPQYGVRYIAINDNYDTIDPNSVNNDFAGIKNWFNEFYARDTSRKIRAVQKAKGERGVPLTGNALLYISLVCGLLQGASAGRTLFFTMLHRFPHEASGIRLQHGSGSDAAHPGIVPIFCAGMPYKHARKQCHFPACFPIFAV